jgi:hypothetical protein
VHFDGGPSGSPSLPVLLCQMAKSYFCNSGSAVAHKAHFEN